MKKVYMIRHAQSIANAGCPTSYTEKIPLSDLGKQQAQLFAENWTESLDMILYSKYLRTYETAQPLQKKFPDVVCVENPQIHEFTYLDYRNCLSTTQEQRRGLRDVFFQQEDMDYKKGIYSESCNELLTRVKLFREDINALPDGTIAVFSHGQYIRILVDVLTYPRKEYSKKEIQRILFETDDVPNCGRVDITSLI